MTQPQIGRYPLWNLGKSVKVLQKLISDLERLHQLGLVVGDLSDHNIHVDLSLVEPRIFWIDTDSYQFDQFPCQVMQPAFAAPWINGSAKPVFSVESDWYALHVVMCKLHAEVAFPVTVEVIEE